MNPPRGAAEASVIVDNYNYAGYLPGAIESALSQTYSPLEVHSANLSKQLSFERMLSLGSSLFEAQSRSLASLYRREETKFDESEWLAHAWWHLIAAALESLDGVLEPAEPFVLVNADCWGVDEVVRGRPRIPFPECEAVGVCGA